MDSGLADVSTSDGLRPRLTKQSWRVGSADDADACNQAISLLIIGRQSARRTVQKRYGPCPYTCGRERAQVEFTTYLYIAVRHSSSPPPRARPAETAELPSKMFASRCVAGSLLLLSLLHAATAQACDGRGVITRKSVKSLTEQEWDDYVDAHRRLRKAPSGQLLFAKMMNLYEQFSQIHNVNALHNEPLFLVWHRLMLWEWDKALNRVKPGVVQPYFDWSVSASSVFSDPVFGVDRYGGSVRTDGRQRVSTLPLQPGRRTSETR
jgi:Common central domain of tyrosinase